MKHIIFDNLFVLELANNHWGSLQRGFKIIDDYSKVIRFNGVKATIKLQFRQVDTLIHKNFRDMESVRYIKKTLDTELTWKEHEAMVDRISSKGLLTMATPFDETSVDKCVEFDLDLIKVASSDIKDWTLLEKIAGTRKPVAISTGGTSIEDIDKVVSFFNKRSIPLAINHCVSLYPSKDSDLELNQIDFFVDRYPNNVIGFSTHEQHSWDTSMLMSYAKGARTWERHIDIDYEGVPISPYCSLPHQVDIWFKTFLKAREMAGGSRKSRRVISQEEVDYLNRLVRGVYAKRNLKKGEKITANNIYLAIPLFKGQISSRELMIGMTIRHDIKSDAPIDIDDIEADGLEASYAVSEIKNRGLIKDEMK
jgi:N-acetylneuraminate synthase